MAKLSLRAFSWVALAVEWTNALLVLAARRELFLVPTTWVSFAMRVRLLATARGGGDGRVGEGGGTAGGGGAGSEQ